MSAAWMSGYVSDVAYTLGYYRELAPSFLNYVCVSNGFEGIRNGRRLRYCELGCGRGYGTALLAAANPDIDFVGIDFNPTHIGEARAFAEKCELANLTLLEISFAEAAASADKMLAEFDVVALHGVYTWVDAGVRKDIVDFLRTKLVPGGIAYMSYNTLPGWAAAAPIQHILKETADRTTGDSYARLRRAGEVLQQLLDNEAGYVAQNAGIKGRIEALGKQDINYLAHEFLHAHWEPIYVTEAFRDLAEAKLSYVGSAAVAENRLAFGVPGKMAGMVGNASDLAMREQLKDYASNKQFRRDVYVKGPIKLSPAQQVSRFEALVFALTGSASARPESWNIPAGQAKPKPGIAEAIVSRLDAGPATGRELDAAAVKAGFPSGEVQQVLEVLIHNQYVTPGRADASRADGAASARLNKAVLELALADDTHRFLAAPALGSAIGANYLERLAIPVILDNGDADDAALAELVLQRMEGAGKRMSRDGKALDRGNIDEITRIVATMREQAVPRLRALGIAN